MNQADPLLVSTDRHTTLSLINLDATEGEVQDTDQATAPGPEVVAAARAVLGSDAVRRARASSHLLRDVPLLARIEAVFLDETADLVFDSAEDRQSSSTPSTPRLRNRTSSRVA